MKPKESLSPFLVSSVGGLSLSQPTKQEVSPIESQPQHHNINYRKVSVKLSDNNLINKTVYH